jgi:hypothetical protein
MGLSWNNFEMKKPPTIMVGGRAVGSRGYSKSNALAWATAWVRLFTLSLP